MLATLFDIVLGPTADIEFPAPDVVARGAPATYGCPHGREAPYGKTNGRHPSWGGLGKAGTGRIRFLKKKITEPRRELCFTCWPTEIDRK
jgi:hypothetical protein